jgi:hypothetical protein
VPAPVVCPGDSWFRQGLGVEGRFTAEVVATAVQELAKGPKCCDACTKSVNASAKAHPGSNSPADGAKSCGTCGPVNNKYTPVQSKGQPGNAAAAALRIDARGLNHVDQAALSHARPYTRPVDRIGDTETLVSNARRQLLFQARLSEYVGTERCDRGLRRSPRGRFLRPWVTGRNPSRRGPKVATAEGRTGFLA